MKSIHRCAVLGLLWLAFSVVASATTSFTIESYNFSTAGDGGGFLAYLNGDSADSFEVFCADYLNTVSPPETFDVNIDIVGITVADTRYGTTSPSGFSDPITVNGSLATAEERYVMAGWLTTQYNLSGDNSNMNMGIQDAIWTLLNTGNYTQFSNSYESAELAAAIAWANAAIADGTFNSFADEVEVFSSTNISGASTPGRYTTGVQEMIAVIPEPMTLALAGIGLLSIGLFRRRKKI